MYSSICLKIGRTDVSPVYNTWKWNIVSLVCIRTKAILKKTCSNSWKIYLPVGFSTIFICVQHFTVAVGHVSEFRMKEFNSYNLKNFPKIGNNSLQFKSEKTATNFFALQTEHWTCEVLVVLIVAKFNGSCILYSRRLVVVGRIAPPLKSYHKSPSHVLYAYMFNCFLLMRFLNYEISPPKTNKPKDEETTHVERIR